MSGHNRLIVRSCQIGAFIQAITVNLTPLLFLPLRDAMGLTWEQIGRLILINFTAQMLTDIICCGVADRVNTRVLIVAANALSGVGLWIFAFSGSLFANPYDGIVAGTIVFSVGCGLLEVLLSPIINAVPSERKARDMALLHAFYPIGKICVILLTGLALWKAGTSAWPWIAVAWSIMPLANTVPFLLAAPPALAQEGRRQPLRELVRMGAFWRLLVILLLSGATEISIGQWTSTYMEKGLGWPREVANLLGFGLFAVGMIVGRLWFARHGAEGHLDRIIRWGAVLSAVSYLVMALSPWPVMALVVSAPAGLFVSMLWPGTVSLTAARFPLAGASMFAMLAAFGDIGAAVIPWGVGAITDCVAAWTAQAPWPGFTPDQLGLRAGLLFGTLAPLALAWLSWRRKTGEAA